MKLWERDPDLTPQAPDRKPVVGDTPAKKNKIIGILFLSVVFVSITLLGAPVDLQCDRLEPGGPVNCLKEVRLGSLLPLSQQRIEDVRGAVVAETTDSEGGTTYRVELRTPGGMVPLRGTYISSRARQDKFVEQLNAFVNSPAAGTLALREPGSFAPENFLCISGWVLFMVAASWLRRMFKPS